MVNASPTRYEQKNETAADARRAAPDSACHVDMLWANPAQHTADGGPNTLQRDPHQPAIASICHHILK
jgi:hypothetical protein